MDFNFNSINIMDQNNIILILLLIAVLVAFYAIYLAFECKKKHVNKFGTHTLFVGKVELIHTENKISKKSILDTSIISPTLYLGADHYITINKKSFLNLKSIPFHKSYSVKNIKLIK